MGVTVELVVLFIFSGSLVCDARELMSSSLSSREPMTYEVSVLQMNHSESEREVKALEIGRNRNVCTMCEEFAIEAIEYLAGNKTQLEIIDILGKTCSQLVPLEQQCLALEDYYVPFLFQEMGSMQPRELCQTVNLCEPWVITSMPISEDKCEICEYAVKEVLMKLKDPDTQLDILELLLRACDAVESYVKKCKTMVLEYGPSILSNAEEFLETTDICAIIHACDLPCTGCKQATLMEVNVVAQPKANGG